MFSEGICQRNAFILCVIVCLHVLTLEVIFKLRCSSIASETRPDMFEREWDDGSPKRGRDLCGVAPQYFDLFARGRAPRLVFKSGSAPLTASAYGWEFIKTWARLCILRGRRRRRGAASYTPTFPLRFVGSLWSVTQDKFCNVRATCNNRSEMKRSRTKSTTPDSTPMGFATISCGLLDWQKLRRYNNDDTSSCWAKSLDLMVSKTRVLVLCFYKNVSPSPAGCFITHCFRKNIPTMFQACFKCLSRFLHWLLIKYHIFNNWVCSIYQPTHYNVQFDICLFKDLYLFMSLSGINCHLFIPFGVLVSVNFCFEALYILSVLI